MQVVIDRLAEILTAEPDPLLAAGKISAFKPSGSLDIPALVCTLALDDEGPRALGPMRREGSIIAHSTRVARADAGANGFSQNLRSLRLEPLPLKRNPAATTAAWSDQDISVRNVTTPEQPAPYRLTARPAAATDFRLDPAEAVLWFGAAQSPGDLLEVSHWTVTWMEDIVGVRFSGLLNLAAWANTREQLAALSAQAQSKLAGGGESLRRSGFIRLSPAGLEAAENLRFQPVTGSVISVWVQAFSYRFRFEAEIPPEISSGIPIQRIDVAIARPEEALIIRRS